MLTAKMHVEGWQKCMYGGKCSLAGVKKKKKKQDKEIRTVFHITSYVSFQIVVQHL